LHGDNRADPQGKRCAAAVFDHFCGSGCV